MPVNVFQQYADSIEQLTAEEMLRKFEVAIFPNLKTDAQKEKLRFYKKSINQSAAEGIRFEDAFKEVQRWQKIK